MADLDGLKVFSGSANPALAKEIASQLGTRVADAEVKKFSDGESSVLLNESVRGKDVFIVQPTCSPVNENVMELVLMIDAARRASARRVCAVVPYYGYGRQDRLLGRSPISAALVADLIEAAGAHSLVSVDFHSQSLEGFFKIPCDNLSAIQLFADYFTKKGMTGGKGLSVVSPDVGGVKRARGLARLLEAPLVVVDKQRPKPNASEVMNVIGEVRGRSCLMVDDMVDTGGTLAVAAKALLDKGAKEVYACATHGVLSGGAHEILGKSAIKQVIVTNSIPLRQGAPSKIVQLSLAPLLSEAIDRIHTNRSISELFMQKKAQKQRTL